MAVIDLLARPCQCEHPRELHVPKRDVDFYGNLEKWDECVTCGCTAFDEMHDNLRFVEYIDKIKALISDPKGSIL